MSIIYVFEDEHKNQFACETITAYNDHILTGKNLVATIDTAHYLISKINYEGFTV